MKAYQLHIRNMVCDRCIYVVRQILKHLNVVKAEVELGKVLFLTTRENILPVLEKRLNEIGLPVIKNKEEILIESIRLEVEKYLDALEHKERIKKFSEFSQKRLGKNYYNLSKFFKDNEKITLETYVIRQKAERVKRLIRENELSLKEIAERLHYASLQHLSAQFRRITGLTITQFKKQEFTERSHRSITSALAELKSRGFTQRFEASGESLVYDLPLKKISFKDAQIKEVYRFDEKPGSFGQSVIFEIEGNDGTKGFIICQNAQKSNDMTTLQ